MGIVQLAGAQMKDAFTSYAAKRIGTNELLSRASSFIGESETDLKQDLISGKTLGEIIDEQDISKLELKSMAEAELSKWLNSRIQDGTLTQLGKQKIVDKFDGLYDTHIDYILSLDATQLSKLQLVR